MMKKISLIILVFLNFKNLFSQKIEKIINENEVSRIEKTLSSDEMQGRKPNTVGIELAANFIATEFKKNKLPFFTGLNSYVQNFSLIKTKFINATGNINGSLIDSKNIISFTTFENLSIDEKQGYEKVSISNGANLKEEAVKFIKSSKNYLVLVDSSFANDFGRLTKLKRETFKTDKSVIFILTSVTNITNYNFEIKQTITENKLSNIVGMLPGKTKPDEYVIFSAHYDHLGIGKPNAAGDSIYNGANDDAAGTTAVIMLANYFSSLKNNDRTLIFVAFTAEESGGFGSKYFSEQLNADKVIAMFNIEMIGTEIKWGKNSAFITGYEKSNMGTILQANLVNSKFKFEPDPYTEQNLFYRSDNATLAALGVPAHTISTSKMNDEKYYHTQEDEIETLDMKNMAEIIKAIAISGKTIINGKDTPTRIQKL